MVGILMPDGSINYGEELKCNECGKPLEWEHLDRLGEINLEMYGILCWECLRKRQIEVAKYGY